MGRVNGTSQPCGKSRVKFIEAKCEKKLLLSVAQLSLSSLKCDVGNNYMNIMLK